VGKEGAIRYRTPGQVSGYLVDGALEPFDDGWFVPGDRGHLTAEGHLVLTGRDSELLNLGGVKIDPQRIDDLAAGFPGLVDAAAFGIERRAGLPEAALAVVCAPHCDLRELDRRLRNALPAGHPTAYWRIDAIPRSRLGKPLRARLTSDYERIALRRA
jgi:acyl-CoA synthetase (AMP-forming)/AMP-acid ligase II